MNILDNIEKRAFRINIIISLALMLVILVLAIFNLVSYLCILTFFLGVVVSMVAYYYTARTIHLTNYTYLKKATTRLFSIRMLAYGLVMVLSYIITKEPLSIIITTIGILILKVSLYISNIKRNRDGSN